MFCCGFGFRTFRLAFSLPCGGCFLSFRGGRLGLLGEIGLQFCELFDERLAQAFLGILRLLGGFFAGVAEGLLLLGEGCGLL